MAVDYTNLTLDDEEEVENDGCTPGDTQPADDVCNECVCTENQNWACTVIYCPDEVDEESTGNESEVGEGVPGFGITSVLLMLAGTAILNRRRIQD